MSKKTQEQRDKEAFRAREKRANRTPEQRKSDSDREKVILDPFPFCSYQS